MQQSSLAVTPRKSSLKPANHARSESRNLYGAPVNVRITEPVKLPSHLNASGGKVLFTKENSTPIKKAAVPRQMSNTAHKLTSPERNVQSHILAEEATSPSKIGQSSAKPNERSHPASSMKKVPAFSSPPKQLTEFNRYEQRYQNAATKFNQYQ